MPGDTLPWGAIQAVSTQAAWPAGSDALYIAGLTLPLPAQKVVLMIFAGLLAWVTITDLIRFTIPNTAVTAIFVLWVVWVITAAEASTFHALGIGIAIFAVGAVLFHYGQMGGGDVKLMTVLGIWAGPEEIFIFLIHVSLAGGLLTMAYVFHGRVIAPALGTIPTATEKRMVPYGVAVSAAGFLLIARLW